MKECAYDYEKQVWVEGPAAIPLLLKQGREHLALLEGPKGREYFAWGKKKNSIWGYDATLQRVRDEVKRLENYNG